MKIFLKAWLTGIAIMIPLIFVCVYLPNICYPEQSYEFGHIKIIKVNNLSTGPDKILICEDKDFDPIAWVTYDGHVRGIFDRSTVTYLFDMNMMPATMYLDEGFTAEITLAQKIIFEGGNTFIIEEGCHGEIVNTGAVEKPFFMFKIVKEKK